MSQQVLLVDSAHQQAAQQMFPHMVIVGNLGAPEDDFDAQRFAGREVIVWAHYADFLAERIAPVATKVAIAGAGFAEDARRYPVSFGGSTVAAKHYLRHTMTRYAGSAPQPPPTPVIPPDAPPAAAERPTATITPITEARTRQQAKPQPAPDADELPARYSHDSLAAAFTAEHPDWRHVGDWGKWLCWNGSYWKADTTGSVLELARQVCRTAGADARSRDIPASTIRDILKVGTIGAVEKIARSDPAHARSVEQWDADPWALNTPGGIVDLRDGSIRPGCPQDHATRITRAVPTPDSLCPAWMQFLVDATNSNAELMRYLQRMVGYFLTGSVRDHALFFFHGNGGNGKGTFLRAINWILNDYAWTADADVFIEQKSPQHKTELASFMGRRLVSSEEINEGARWNEARINKLTGGDTITANFMRQDQFAFAPTHKLLIVANNKPMFRNVGDAIRRRLHLIPFTHKIEKPDGKIEDRLRAEANGILRWAVAGCQEWQRIGLDPPELVRLATDGYLSSQDSIATWITESCEVPTEELRRLSPASYWETRTGELFNSYRAWSDSNGEPGLGRKRFTQAMETRGFATREESKRFYVAGIRLRPQDRADH